MHYRLSASACRCSSPAACAPTWPTVLSDHSRSNQHMNRSAPYFTKPRRPISPSLYEKITGGSASRGEQVRCERDRKSTRLNSSHLVISYAVFCLKKKMKRY